MHPSQIESSHAVARLDVSAVHHDVPAAPFHESHAPINPGIVKGAEDRLAAQPEADQIQIHENDAKLHTLVQNSRVFTRTTPGGLAGIVASGKLKTVFDTDVVSGTATGRTSTGEYAQRRAQAEHLLFGLAEDSPVTARPIYGYMADDPKGLIGHDHDFTKPGALQSINLDGYGGIALKLREGVGSRTSYSFGDSIDNGILDADVTPDGTIIQHARSMNVPSPLTGDVTPGMSYRRHGNDKLMRLAVSTDHPTSVGQLDVPYVEAQVHGGVSLDDIEEVHLAVPIPQELFDSLTRLGIKIFPPPNQEAVAKPPPPPSYGSYDSSVSLGG